MVKIPLHKVDYGGARHLLNMILRARKYRITAPISTLFDTGCPKALIISEGEAARLGIPFSSMSKGEIIVLGGQKYETYLLSEVDLTIYDENDTPIHVNLPDASVLKCTKRSREAIDDAHRMPNIIGLEFLTFAGYTLRSNRTGNIFFET